MNTGKIKKIVTRRPEIVFGLPSWNEADNISKVVKVIDEGLRKYFPKRHAIIVDTDSKSPDGTKHTFLKTKTRTPKKYITAPRGKGRGLRELFDFFLDSGAEVLATVDADVTSVAPDWVRHLISPISEKGYDHVFPIYIRHEFDASITNHICYPLLRGVLGIDLRHPLAGEIALSRRAVDNIFQRPWPPNAYKFGIDIFMTTSSVLADMKIAESYLGYKEHKPSEPKLYKMFEEVTSVLFWQLSNNKGYWNRAVKRLKHPPDFYNGKHKGKVPQVRIDYQHLKSIAARDFKEHHRSLVNIMGEREINSIGNMLKNGGDVDLSAERWVKILYKFVLAHEITPLRRAKILRPLYFARFLTFYKHNLDNDHDTSEKAVLGQATLFYKKRDLLIK